MNALDAFYSPPGSQVTFDTRIVTVERSGGAVAIRFPVLDGTHVRDLALELRAAQQELRTRTVAEIVDVLDAVAARWLDPQFEPRREVIPAIAAVTGFSQAMVAHAIDLEQRSSRRADLLGALDRELGTRAALDGFVQTEMGRATAVGPALVGGIFSANIPALPHLTVLRSFLVKAACLGRVSRGEPLYLAAYARSLAAVDPLLGRCLAVTWWPSEDTATEGVFLREIDHLIAYGGDAALRAISGRAPAGLSATWHGHRLGAAVVLRGALTPSRLGELAEQIAYDFTLFDQHACLAPQAVYVEEGGQVAPVALAKVLARTMFRWAAKLPPRALALEDAVRLRSAREALAVREALGQDVTLLTPWEVLSPTVALTPPGPLDPSPLDRFVRVIPVPDRSVALECLRPVARHLQCVSVASGPDDPTEFELALARLGVTRLCPPGLMGLPSMRWAHDGMPCLSRLVRWCDSEERAP